MSATLEAPAKPTMTSQEASQKAEAIEKLASCLRKFLQSRQENVEAQKEQAQSRMNFVDTQRQHLADIEEEVVKMREDITTDPELEKVGELNKQAEKEQAEHEEDLDRVYKELVELFELANIPLPDLGAPKETQTTQPPAIIQVGSGGVQATLIVSPVVPSESEPVVKQPSQVSAPKEPESEEMEEITYRSARMWTGTGGLGEYSKSDKLAPFFQASQSAYEGTHQEYVEECDRFYAKMGKLVRGFATQTDESGNYSAFVACAWLANLGWTCDEKGNRVKFAHQSDKEYVEALGRLYAYAQGLLGKSESANKETKKVKEFAGKNLKTLLPEVKETPPTPEPEEQEEQEEGYDTPPNEGTRIPLKANAKLIEEVLEEVDEESIRAYTWDAEEECFNPSETEYNSSELGELVNAAQRRIRKEKPGRLEFWELGERGSGRYCIRQLDEDNDCYQFVLFDGGVIPDDEEEEDSAANGGTTQEKEKPTQAPLKPVVVQEAPKGKFIRKDRARDVESVFNTPGAVFTLHEQDGKTPLVKRTITKEEARNLLNQEGWVLHKLADGSHAIRNPGKQGKQGEWLIYPRWVTIIVPAAKK